MHPITKENFRVLVADDEEKYIELYQHILSENSPFLNEADTPELLPFDFNRKKFEITCCRQGDAAVSAVKQSLDKNQPFSVAFIDVRMPPGPDGIWAAKQIRQLDPRIEIAIVTGYSDYSPEDIVARIPPVHKLIYIQKPFRLKEIYHFANVLSAKRNQEQNILNINKNLEQKVAARTAALHLKNNELLREVAQRTRAEEALRKSEQSYRLLVEQQIDLIVKFNHSGNLLFVSPSFCITMGKHRNALIGKPYISLVHDDEKENVRQAIKRTHSAPFSAYIEEKALTRHGWRWFAWVYTGVPDKNGFVDATLAVGRDITERKQTELDLKDSREKLQLLYSHLVKAQEEERKRIASNLHDDLGQTLAVLKLRIQSILNQLSPNQVKLTGECEETIKYVNRIIEHIRRISHDLSPAALDDLGLVDALKALAEDFAKHTHATLTMDIAKINNLLPATSEVIIYRVFQEVFTNIEKHSEAANVKIHIQKEKKRIRFQIKDGGKGFDMKRLELASTFEKGLGFSSMDERVKMLGGQLNINSRIGQGTTISFSLPYDQ